MENESEIAVQEPSLLPASKMIDRELVDLAMESHADALDLFPSLTAKILRVRADECRAEILKRLAGADGLRAEIERLTAKLRMEQIAHAEIEEDTFLRGIAQGKGESAARVAELEAEVKALAGIPDDQPLTLAPVDSAGYCPSCGSRAPHKWNACYDRVNGFTAERMKAACVAKVKNLLTGKQVGKLRDIILAELEAITPGETNEQ